MEIYLIRHTSVDCEKGICYGMSDVGLSNTFIEESKVIKEKIKAKNIDVFYSSPLKRCLLLAQFLTNTNIVTDGRLKEINFGNWELQSWEKISKEAYFTEWSYDFVNLKTPDGESFGDLYNRVDDFFQELVTKNHSKVGLVIHGGVIRSILCSILKMPIKNADLLALDYGGVTKITIDRAIIKIEYINR